MCVCVRERTLPLWNAVQADIVVRVICHLKWGLWTMLSLHSWLLNCVEHSVDGVITDDGSPSLSGPAWVAGALGSVLLCWLPAPWWPGAQGPRDKCLQEAFKGRPVEQNQQRTRKAREIDLLQVIHYPWDSTPENCILNLGKLKGKTVFSLRTLYQDQANNNAVVRGLPVGSSHDPSLFCLHPKQTSGGK